MVNLTISQYLKDFEIRLAVNIDNYDIFDIVY